MSTQADIELLKYQLEQQKIRDIDNAHKIEELADQLDAIQERLHLGKGLFLGFVFGLGGFAVVSFDSIRNLFHLLVK